jgi:hypothetical protein
MQKDEREPNEIKASLENNLMGNGGCVRCSCHRGMRFGTKRCEQRAASSARASSRFHGIAKSRARLKFRVGCNSSHEKIDRSIACNQTGD